MIGIGFFEIVIIAIVCFIAVGPKQLPMLMRKIAGFYRQFTSLRDELRFQILSADDDMKKNIDDMRLSKPILENQNEKIDLHKTEEKKNG